MEPLLKIRELQVRFFLKEGTVHAVNGVDLDIFPNRTLGIVGESGCGKSITARSTMQILPPRGKITGGEITLFPRTPGETPINITMLHPNGKTIRTIRGGEISMVFQEPMTSFSPVHTIGNQIAECVRLHHKNADGTREKLTSREIRDRVIEMLRLVGVPMAEKRFYSYPHQLSGGLRQRCMIAMALSCRPRLLIADEPTTALDVTIQSQILDLILNLQKELGMAVMFITHDLGVIAETADDVAVMYMGRVVEKAPVESLFENPKHPYTIGLLQSVPQIRKNRGKRLASIPGSVPSPFTHLAGCPFHPRCSSCIPGKCDTGQPPSLMSVSDEGHQVACYLHGEGSVE